MIVMAMPKDRIPTTSDAGALPEGTDPRLQDVQGLWPLLTEDDRALLHHVAQRRARAEGQPGDAAQQAQGPRLPVGVHWAGGKPAGARARVKVKGGRLVSDLIVKDRR